MEIEDASAFWGRLAENWQADAIYCFGSGARGQATPLSDLDTGVLTGGFARRIRGMAGFRNVLVHGYADVDLELVHQYPQDNPKDFAQFIEQAMAFIQAQNP